MATGDFRSQSVSDCDDELLPYAELYSQHDSDSPPPLFNPSKSFPEEIDDALIPGAAVRTFASSVNRIAGGCQVIVEMLMQETSDDARRLPSDPHSPPVLLGAFHRGQLFLMLSAAMEGLARDAERLTERTTQISLG